MTTTKQVAVKERPILMSGPMVRALLDGRKTQTRRIVKPQPPEDWRPDCCERYTPTKIARNGEEYPGDEIFGAYNDDWGVACPFGGPGDRLWVRETFLPCKGCGTECKPSEASYVCYRDGTQKFGGIKQLHPWTLDKPPDWEGRRFSPSIHMPRWASRLTLEITDVRVERLLDISEEDAKREGVPHSLMASTHKIGFENLWNSINGTNAHEANPFVWVICFRRLAGETP